MKKYTSLVVFLLLSCSAFAEEASHPFWIGIVRIDGILVPIGVYDKDKWVNTWPELSIDENPEVDKLVKITDGKVQLQDIPALWKGAIRAVPTNIYFWTQGPRPKILKVLYAERYYPHCSGGWALKTDLQPTKKVDYSPTPKIGIASNYATNVYPFEKIKSDSKISISVIQAIKTKFEEKEKADLPISIKSQLAGSIELTRIYIATHELNGKSLYFVEAQRKYPKPKDEQDADCYNLNSLNSWVLLEGKKVSFLSSEFIASDCDGKEMNDIVPDAVISIRGKLYTISESYGYEWESYIVQEIFDGAMQERLNVGGGGC